MRKSNSITGSTPTPNHHHYHGHHHHHHHNHHQRHSHHHHHHHNHHHYYHHNLQYHHHHKERLLPLYKSILADKHYVRDSKDGSVAGFLSKLLGIKNENHLRPRLGHKSRSTTSITKSSVLSSYQLALLGDCISCANDSKHSYAEVSPADGNSPSCISTLNWEQQYLQQHSVNKSTNAYNTQDTAAIQQPNEANAATRISNYHKRTVSSAAMDALVTASLKSAAAPINTITDRSDDVPTITLSGHSHDTDTIMTESIADMIRSHFPKRYRIHGKWYLQYSLDQHGASLRTLFSNMKEGACVLIIKDTSDQLFGAYLSDSFALRTHYYGTGECFLWKASLNDNTEKGTISEIKSYKWTGKNDYMMLSNSNFIAVGGGDGTFGLWLNSNLEQGYNSTCPTFDNEMLTLEPNFRCVGLEIWSLNM